MKKWFLLLLIPFTFGFFLVSCDPNGPSGDNTIIGDDDDTGPTLPAIQSPTALTNWDGAPTVIGSPLGRGYFGSVIAISRDGNTIVASNYRDDRERETSGGGFAEYHPVTVFRTSGTSRQRYSLQPSDSALDLTVIDYGWSIAVSDNGNIVAVGAKRDSEVYTRPGGGTELLNTGVVYIYTWNGTGYTQSAKISPPIAAREYPQRNMHFGNGVALSGTGNRLVVGAPKFDTDDNYANNNGISRGRVFVFNNIEGGWDNGRPIDPVNASNHNDALNFFGYSVGVSADGNTIVAGARKDSGDGSSGVPTYSQNAGSAYIFHANDTGWDQVKIFAPDRSPDAYFGHSVTISGDGRTVVVGSYRADPSGSDSGSVYAFTRRGGNNWGSGVKLSAIFGRSRDQLGYSVAVSNDGTHIVAGYGLDGGTTTYGRASIFSKDAGGTVDGNNPWIHETILWSRSRFRGDFFGRGVGISGDGSIIVAGIPALLDPTRAGEIAIFE